MKKNMSAIKLERAKQWVQEAGIFLRDNLSNPMEITEKSRHDDLVTNFDTAVQELIVGHILSDFPEDLILAEEDKKSLTFSADLPHLWILDPIDGTTNFIVQKDKFAIMLAYYEYGVGKFGIILNVMKNKLYWCDENDAYCDKVKLTQKKYQLSQSLIGVNAYMYRTNTGGLLTLSLNTLGVRSCGSAGISYTELIEGKIMGYFSNLQVWDYAAGQLITDKLGFVTKTLDGQAPRFDGRQMIYTVPADLLDEVQEKMRQDNF